MCVLEMADRAPVEEAGSGVVPQGDPAVSGVDTYTRKSFYRVTIDLQWGLVLKDKMGQSLSYSHSFTGKH